MKWFGSPMGHNVVVDGIDEQGMLTVRDPWNATTYALTMQVFYKYWGLMAIWEAV